MKLNQDKCVLCDSVFQRSSYHAGFNKSSLKRRLRNKNTSVIEALVVLYQYEVVIISVFARERQTVLDWQPNKDRGV